MQFNSVSFIFFFFPIFLLLYYGVMRRMQSAVLIAGSLVFYGLASGGNYWWIALLVVLTVLSYLVQRFLSAKRKAFLLAAFLLFLAGVLSFLKVYQGGILLPAGASFYMFQMAAVLADVFSGKITPYQSFLLYARDMVMFPKLLSGPIVQPQKLRSFPKTVRGSIADIREGLHTLVLGLALKVILANNLGGLWFQPAVIGYAYISTPAAWLALISFAMQLYLDFYGYSLMAIGIGKMLGFDLPANFLEPYSARTVSDFYRRWHATLGAWFKAYVYIPLGGNRKGLLRTLLNIAVVWLFTGLWHGVGGNYLLWAGFLCILIINERLWLGKFLEKSRVFSHFYVVGAILISWIPFAVGQWDQMLLFCARLFGTGGEAMDPMEFVPWLKMYAWVLGAGVLAMTPLPAKLWRKLPGNLVRDLVIFVLFWVVAYYICTEAQNPFMYFQY